MSYGCGSVGLPIIRRALIFFLAAETAYVSYELVLKPGIPHIYNCLTNKVTFYFIFLYFHLHYIDIIIFLKLFFLFFFI
ncbi:conserved Plasmodium protein, unknown function [Plasmodium relictum]|uniref:Uncharacterized protein n=1 Tax=Plasmodium relictum TaxID=85471 RepID=A0A1J1H1V7_PLARL|nr:conserved Plasmodium protein, unknown function [Plasmodium relictum]CRG98904.1 conserved Plasmodium protein, unknown function [Plasmodium relictum]